MNLRLSSHPAETPASEATPHREGEAPVMNLGERTRWMDALMKEKTLYQAWLSSLQIKRSPANLIIPAVVGMLLVGYVQVKFSVTPASQMSKATESMAINIRSWTDLVLGSSPSVLGFLIAGFTIFATLGKPSLFAKMAVRQDPQAQGQSYLKAGFLRLLRVFAEYWAFTLYCLMLKLFLFADGPMSLLSQDPNSTMKYRIFALVFVLTGSCFTYVVMILQSFIFNIYSLVTMGIRWDVEGWGDTPAS